MGFSWETRPAPTLTLRRKTRTRTFALRLPYPELIGLIALAGTLNLWALSRNGRANEYYAAAVRSMSTSWHNFLFAALSDLPRSGKPLIHSQEVRARLIAKACTRPPETQ
jgi:hypothetical protein